ncbi:hypothetical protein NHQ30_001800 [Ciborinia camelliae]|nr:hypothetical protein NHQ30_001800 [Ciborinia camelliae]
MADDTTSSKDSKPDIYKLADKDGHFHRKSSQFRDWVSTDPDAKFPAESGRYVLYLNRGCPWIYEGPTSEPCDPIYGFTKHSQLYYKADPNYSGRFTVPVLWDRKRETIVNNESSEIIRMFYTAFDSFIPASLSESHKPLFPLDKREEIESMNAWVYETINNGVYKCGFASTQAAYDENIHPLFASLDHLESRLASAHTPFLFGSHITDADIRLYTTIVRFDVAYHTLFKCNLKMIRHDYPCLHRWLRTLYWDVGSETNGGAFGSATTDFRAIKEGYTFTLRGTVVPAGPERDILPL